MSAPQSQSDAEFARAFDIHKDADNQLHSRLNTYTTAQSFLVAAYAAIIASEGRTTGTMLLLLMVIPVFAIIVGVIYFRYCQRLVHGIEYLKKHYLNDSPIYSGYIAAARGSSAQKVHYNMHYYLILFISLFWVAALVITLTLPLLSPLPAK